jgi:hypothetical protein
MLLVQKFRERVFDPERFELLRVRHEKFGYRWVHNERIWSGAEAFVAYIEDKFPSAVDKIGQARTVILQTAPQFVTNRWFLLPAGDMDKDEEEGVIQLLYDAAAFLLRCGIQCVDQDATEASFGVGEVPTLH